MNRRDFVVGAALAVELVPHLGRAQTPAPGAPPPEKANTRFFRDAEFEYIFLCLLGLAYDGGVDVGSCLAIAEQIVDGDAASAFQAFIAAGARLRDIAELSAKAAHRVSARQAFLHASNVIFTATYFADRAGVPDHLLPTFTTHRGAWDRFVDLFDEPVERVRIPYQGTTLPGYFFRAPGAGRKPVLILNNGSDGSVSFMWSAGLAAGLARGYHCLVFDGPGQGATLWLQKLSFRPDWEKVITPVVDFLVARDDVDVKRIALLGVSQGGYWVPRAAAFEHRLAAIVADPGVWDVSTSWTGHLPPPVLHMLDAGDRTGFDAALRGGPRQMALLAFRMRPYGMTSPYDVFKATQQYRLAEVAGLIRCPVLVTDPDAEQFWPGQSRLLFDALHGNRELIRFTAADGAAGHCEPTASGLRAQRIFDWLDSTLSQPT
jgi:dienelactone hydrolase